MKNIQKILNAVLEKNVFEYILMDEKIHVLGTSSGIKKYVGKALEEGDDVLEWLPEFVGAEAEIKNIFSNPLMTYALESVHKKEYYVNISIEYFDENSVLVLLHNITDNVYSNQKLLQYSNESILLGNTLQKILDRQNALLFVTNNNDITYTNEQFMDYFGMKRVSDIPRKQLKLYKYVDESLTSYDMLFERVNSKEEYVTINKDTFILKATKIEDTHNLFTLTKVTKLSNEMQRDSLTGAYKKYFFNRQLQKAILEKEDSVVVVIDIDNFKMVNDTHGHQAGDTVLKEFATLIQNNIRGEDIFARWGGEEFLLLLQHTTLENAMKKIERLRNMLEAYSFSHVGQMTASFGVAWKEDSDDLHAILQRADKALYEAKKLGKNKVVFKKL